MVHGWDGMRVHSLPLWTSNTYQDTIKARHVKGRQLLQVLCHVIV